VRASHARVMNQLVLLVFPDRSLHIKRRFTRDERPTVTPVGGVKGHMVLVDFNASSSQPHGEELLKFRRVELPVDHFIDQSTDLQPLRHDTFLAYPVAVFLLLRFVTSSSHHGNGIL